MTRIDIDMLRRQIAALFAEVPELSTDEEFKVDVLEGQTDAIEALDWLVAQIRNAGTIQDAIDLRIKDLDKRKDRFEMREKAYRRLALQIMEAADLRKLQLPEATLSVRPAQPHVVLVHPDLIPPEYWRVKKEPNLSAIKAALKAGTLIHGAALSNQVDTLFILKG